MRFFLFACERCGRVERIRAGGSTRPAVTCPCGSGMGRTYTAPMVNARYTNSREFEENKNFLGCSDRERLETMKEDDRKYAAHWGR